MSSEAVPQPAEAQELSIQASQYRRPVTSAYMESRHSSEVRVHDAVPSTPESPFPGEARAVPRTPIALWSRGGGQSALGPLGLSKGRTFKRASAPPTLSPVQSEGGDTPKQSPLFRMSPGPTEQASAINRRPLPSTPEGTTKDVETTPCQESAMQERLTPETRAGEDKLSALATLPGAKPSTAHLRAASPGIRRRAGSWIDEMPSAVSRHVSFEPTGPTSGSSKAAARGVFKASPWTCFGEGVYRLLGCNL